MKVYFDDGDNGSFQAYTGKLYNVRPNSSIGAGGQFSCTYETDEINFLSDLPGLLALRGVRAKFQSDDATPHIYFTGFVVDIVNIKPTSCVIIGIQAGKILQDYPAKTNTIIQEGLIRSIDALKINDEWDDPFAGFGSYLVTFSDQNKLVWIGHPDDIDLRVAADSGDYTPSQSGGSEFHANFDNKIYYNVANENFYYANSDVVGAISTNERFWFKFRFRVPKRQGTSFTKVSYSFTMQKNHYTPEVQAYTANFATIHAYTDNAGGSKTELYDFFDNLGDWDSIEQNLSISFGQTVEDWDNYYFGFTQNVLSEPFTIEKDITDLINFTEGHYFHNKVSYNDYEYDLYDFIIYIQVDEANKDIMGYDNSVGMVFYNAQLRVEYDADQDITESFGSIASATAESLTLDGAVHTTPFPQNIGLSIDDIWAITKQLPDNITDMLSNSSADSIFTTNFDAITNIADAADHTLTPLLRVMDLYADMAKAIWFERNFVLNLTSSPTSSGITLTETDIDNYPAGVDYSRIGRELYSKIIIVGKYEQQYPVTLSPPANTYVQDKVKIIPSPDVLTAHQARKIAESLQVIMEKDIITLRFHVRLDTEGKRTNLLPGNTVDVNFQSTNFIDNTAEGNDLVIMDMEYYTDASYDWAIMTLSNKVPF